MLVTQQMVFLIEINPPDAEHAIDLMLCPLCSREIPYWHEDQKMELAVQRQSSVVQQREEYNEQVSWHTSRCEHMKPTITHEKVKLVL